MTDSHPIIAREGWKHVLIALVLAVGATAVSPWLGLPFWVLFLFVTQFFRDPHRSVPAGEGQVVSPADGRVIQVAPATDPLLERPALRISVFMNVFNVHSNRAPEGGEVIKRDYREGAFVNAALDKASDTNEANALSMRTDLGDITFVQIAGLVARRIICDVKVGDKLERGQRYGFIRFGSRVDVYLDEGAEVRVSPGDKVTGGVDVIAVLPEGKGGDG